MEIELKRRDILPVVADYMRESNQSSLEEALTDVRAPRVEMIAALVFGCGNGYVALLDEAQRTVFSAGPSKSTAEFKAELDKDSFALAGPLADLLKDAYSAFAAYEQELESVIYLPPELREQRIQQACSAREIDAEFFRFVVRNLWR